MMNFSPAEAAGRQLFTSGGPSSSTKAEQEPLPRSGANFTSNVALSEGHIRESAAPSQSTALARPAESTTLSTTDSERTLVPLPSSTSLQSISSQVAPELIASLSRKRPRDSNEDGDVDEGEEGNVENRKEDDGDGERERAARRPRLAGYIPEQTDDPTGLGLFLLPFQAFVKGFKASLTK